MDEKVKDPVNSLNLINFGLLGIIFLSVLLFVNRQDFNDTSGINWAIIAIALSVITGCLIWGLIRFKELEVHFKKDKKSNIALSLLLNILGLTLTGTGEYFVFSFQSPISAFQGMAIALVGAVILALTFYLYNRFIPEQIK